MGTVRNSDQYLYPAEVNKHQGLCCYKFVILSGTKNLYAQSECAQILH